MTILNNSINWLVNYDTLLPMWTVIVMALISWGLISAYEASCDEKIESEIHEQRIESLREQSRWNEDICAWVDYLWIVYSKHCTTPEQLAKLRTTYTYTRDNLKPRESNS